MAPPKLYPPEHDSIGLAELPLTHDPLAEHHPKISKANKCIKCFGAFFTTDSLFVALRGNVNYVAVNLGHIEIERSVVIVSGGWHFVN